MFVGDTYSGSLSTILALAYVNLLLGFLAAVRILPVSGDSVQSLGQEDL